MMAQQYAMRKKTPPPASPQPHMGAVEGLQARLGNRRQEILKYLVSCNEFYFRKRKRRKRKGAKTQNIPRKDQDPFTKVHFKIFIF